MSYDVYIYHVEVAKKTQSGIALDAFEHTPIDVADMSRFLDRIAKYGYERDNTAGGIEFTKEVAGCAIQVAVFPTEIAFSIPFWEDLQDALTEARMDAIELSDSETTAVYDPQNDDWIE